MAEEGETFDPDPETICAVCSAEFLDAEDLDIHMKQVHVKESGFQACHFCPSTFSNLEKYAYHLRDVHITSLKSCRYCKKVFTGFEALRSHEIKHNTAGSKTLFSCSQCKAVFENTLNLEQHELQEHNNDVDGLMLHKVFPVLSSVLNIKAEIFLQSMGSNTVYICVFCKHTTNDMYNYLNHLKKDQCRSIVCDKCSNVYQDKKSLKRHLYAHKACNNYVKEEDKVKRCTKCGFDVEALHYTSHVLTCNPLNCRICDIHFSSVNELTQHQSKEHPLAISLINCDLCRREFVGKVALEKHMNRVHKEELHLYKYMCVYCDKMYFKHPKSLFYHFMSKHHDLEPYCCKICNQKFRVRKRFTIHIKLDHKSQGFVEFDENYHVFFTDKRSDKPFQPTSLLVKETEDDQDAGSQTEQETQQTDKETDVETNNKPKAGKKPLKIRLKEQKKGVKKANASINSDVMTETEGNVTENDTKAEQRMMTRKRKSKLPSPKIAKKSKQQNEEEFTEVERLESDLSDDEPLEKVKQKVRNMRRWQMKSWNKKIVMKTNRKKFNRKKFTCKICKKYCYTYQNYHHHVSLHFKNGAKKCIKCDKEFRSKAELDRHVAKMHTTSRLTETLKSLLERRKQGGEIPQLTSHERFLKSIKKVRSDTADVPAKITEVTEDLSVQKFIESFTPDENAKKQNVEIDNVVTVKPLKNAVKRPPAIKITKFRPKPVSNNVRLSMPVRFKQTAGEPVKVTIKEVLQPTISDVVSYADQDEPNYNNDYNYQDDYVDYEEEVENTDKNDMVPEMAQEVMLEGSEEPRSAPATGPVQIVLPRVPQGYKQIRIAHLQPQAPFYKIVKVGDVIKGEKKKASEETDENEDVQLPPGTKLVNVNPLAHLMGDTPVEEVVGEPKKKYYKPKTSNFEKAIARALLQLDKPTPIKKTPAKKKSKKSVEVEQ